MHYTLNYFIEIAKQKSNKQQIPTLIVTCPYEEYSIKSINECIKLGLIKAIFVGEKQKIIKAINEANLDQNLFNMVDANNDEDAAEKTMELLKNNEGQMLMKGLIDTSLLLKTLLKQEYGLRDKKLMSHCSVAFNEHYDKFYIITDPAMCIKPTLEQKVLIIENAVFLAHALGIKKPNVACLCAKEKPYDKMPDTLDAQELRNLNINGTIKDCVVSGPLQIDLAIDEESARIKNCQDPVAGKANILFCPNIEAANIFAKGIVYLGGWSFAGVILGAKIPFVLTSRSTNERDRILSIAIACACANYKE